MSSQRERSGGKVQQQIDGHCQPGNYRSITGLEILPPVSVPRTTSRGWIQGEGGTEDTHFYVFFYTIYGIRKKWLDDLYIKYLPSK